MGKKLIGLCLMVILANATTVCGQAPAAGDEHEVLKKDVGVWIAKTKMWQGPGEPLESEGVETNRMVGEFWLVSDFEGEFGGMPFVGHGTMGYDPKAKKYVGTWIDNFSPHGTQMSGTYDKKTNTFTAEGTGLDPLGNPMKTKNVTVYKDDGTRVMTMYAQLPGAEEMTKSLEITYEKKK